MTTSYPVQKSEAEWQEQLSPEEYHVLRQAGTERPWSGEYVDNKDVGVYSCRACGAELFRSETKFDSHCGWPSFYDPADSDAVEEIVDTSHGMRRVRGALQELWRPPGPRVRGLPRPAHRAALLHQQSFHPPRKDRVGKSPHHRRPAGPHPTGLPDACA